MARKQRTDPHRPGAIVPADYTYIRSYELPRRTDGWPCPSFGLNCEIERRVLDAEGRIVHSGEHDADGMCCIAGMYLIAKVPFAEQGGTSKCSVCGTWFARGDVWRHNPTGEHVHLGWCCAEKYSLLVDRSEFELKAERWKRAQARAIKTELSKRARAEFLAKHEGLQEALETDHHIVQDIKGRFKEHCSLSDAQVTLVFKIARERAGRSEEKTVPAPRGDGRITFRGTVVSVRDQETAYGFQTKCTIKVTTDAGVWLAWGTLPSGCSGARRGDVVEITARLRPGRDAYFALMNRPHGIIVEQKEQA